MQREQALAEVCPGEWSEYGGEWFKSDGEHEWRMREGGFGDGIELRLQVWERSPSKGYPRHELKSSASHWHKLGALARTMEQAAGVLLEGPRSRVGPDGDAREAVHRIASALGLDTSMPPAGVADAVIEAHQGSTWSG